MQKNAPMVTAPTRKMKKPKMSRMSMHADMVNHKSLSSYAAICTCKFLWALYGSKTTAGERYPADPLRKLFRSFLQVLALTTLEKLRTTKEKLGKAKKQSEKLWKLWKTKEKPPAHPGQNPGQKPGQNLGQ